MANHSKQQDEKMMNEAKEIVFQLEKDMKEPVFFVFST